MSVFFKWLDCLKVMKREIVLKALLGVGISALYIVQAILLTRILT